MSRLNKPKLIMFAPFTGFWDHRTDIRVSLLNCVIPEATESDHDLSKYRPRIVATAAMESLHIDDENFLCADTTIIPNVGDRTPHLIGSLLIHDRSTPIVYIEDMHGMPIYAKNTKLRIDWGKGTGKIVRTNARGNNNGNAQLQ